MTEVITITITTDKLKSLTQSGALVKSEYDIKYVDVKDYDYSNDKRWIAAKKESDKAYRLLKEVEFDIRSRDSHYIEKHMNDINYNPEEHNG